MRKQTVMTSLFVCVAIIVAGAWLANAGNLAPPVGPVGSTMKTLQEVEPRTPITSLPFTISSSGSYYVANHLDAAFCGDDGIKIDADYVTLDLNGFTITHSFACANNGIVVIGIHTNINIRNGIVRGFTLYGIDLNNVDNCQLTNLVLQENGTDGLRVGNGAYVRGCTFQNNTGAGARVGDGCRIVECSSKDNNAEGIVTGRAAVVQGCSTKDNGGDGISVGITCRVVDCTAEGNGGVGITGDSAATVSGCTVTSNGQGGISTGIGASIVNCVADGNLSHGIIVSSDSLVLNCMARGHLPLNSGIRVTNENNRIEANNVAFNNAGIEVLIDGNIIVKNTGSNNSLTDFSIAPGNSFGPMILVGGVGDIAGTPGAEHPWANFRF